MAMKHELSGREDSKSQATEMRFLRAVRGCTRQDHLKNEDIINELDVRPILQKVTNCRKSWKSHMKRMPDERVPKQMKY
jgi:hypothetical protein